VLDMQISESQNGQSVSMHVGEVLELRLAENASTGYRWSLDDVNKAVLQLEDSGFEASGKAVGGGGRAFWKLRATDAGRAHLEAKQWRSWEGDRSIIGRFSADVTIAPAKK
jgi:inhibitor of cysteine peptidase